MGEVDCVVIADDLTGACDAAVPFTLRGASSIVHVAPESQTRGIAEVQAFNTETRDLDEQTMKRSIHTVAERAFPLHPKLIFKKIDSLMRGSPGREIQTCFEAFGCDLAIITPAFPEMGRTVRNGHLEVYGDFGWTPLHLPSLLRQQGLADHRHASGEIAFELGSGFRFLSFDISCKEDLERLASEAWSAGQKILWAGSAGLSSALANLLYPEPTKQTVYSPGSLPVLFCIGSDHAVTVAQMRALQGQRHAAEFNILVDNPEVVTDALLRGAHTILHLPHGWPKPEQLRCVLRCVKNAVGAILVSGGDTASLVCRSVAAEQIRLDGEIVTGLPWGTLNGGLLDGVAVATKSGAFGREDALIRVADFFTCRHN